MLASELLSRGSGSRPQLLEETTFKNGNDVTRPDGINNGRISQVPEKSRGGTRLTSFPMRFVLPVTQVVCVLVVVGMKR